MDAIFVDHATHGKDGHSQGISWYFLEWVWWLEAVHAVEVSFHPNYNFVMIILGKL